MVPLVCNIRIKSLFISGKEYCVNETWPEKICDSYLMTEASFAFAKPSFPNVTSAYSAHVRSGRVSLLTVPLTGYWTITLFYNK